jgi:hypothetical protein
VKIFCLQKATSFSNCFLAMSELGNNSPRRCLTFGAYGRRLRYAREKFLQITASCASRAHKRRGLLFPHRSHLPQRFH